LIAQPLDAQDAKRKRRFEIGFIVCGLIGVLAIGVTAYRGEGIEAELDQIKHNTETPTKVEVDIPGPSQHTVVAWDPAMLSVMPDHPLLPFRVGQIPSLNLGFRNAGDFTVLSSHDHGGIFVVPTASMDDAFSQHKDEVLNSPTNKGGGGVLVAHNPAGYYRTYDGPKLTPSDVKGLNHATNVLCELGSVDWTDTTGTYRTYIGQCFYRERDGSFNWHVLPENNHEEKIK
jgi:hypothetical protein